MPITASPCLNPRLSFEGASFSITLPFPTSHRQQCALHLPSASNGSFPASNIAGELRRPDTAPATGHLACSPCLRVSPVVSRSPPLSCPVTEHKYHSIKMP